MRVFLDAQTAPWHPAARAAFEAAADHAWADPRALHSEGRQAARTLAEAREQVAAVMGCRADEVVFDSSGAAASRRAITGLYLARQRTWPRIITSAVETASILGAIDACAFTSSVGADFENSTIGVSHDGMIDVEELRNAATAPAALACIQAANAETGVIQDSAAISDIVRAAGIPWVMDATALMPYSTLPEDWDIAVADAAAWAGPSGVGVLAIRTGTRWRTPDHVGDAYEFGRVPGMPSVPAIAAAAAALTSLRAESASNDERLRTISAHVRQRIVDRIPHVQLHSTDAGCPHINSMSFLYVSGEALAARLDARGFAVGSGSACANERHTPSHVLAAMGRLTEGNLRITLPWNATLSLVDEFVDALAIEVAAVRELLGAADL